jgi:hypothetical protein
MRASTTHQHCITRHRAGEFFIFSCAHNDISLILQIYYNKSTFVKFFERYFFRINTKANFDT